MKLIDKIKRYKFKPKCGLSIGVNTMGSTGNQGSLAASTGFVGATTGTLPAFLPNQKPDSLLSKFSEIEEICFRNNADAKELIGNINGVVAIEDGKANEQYEAIRVIYSPLVLDLSLLMKIYSFTSGDRAVFAKDSQKDKLLNTLKNINISIDIIDLINFE